MAFRKSVQMVIKRAGISQNYRTSCSSKKFERLQRRQGWKCVLRDEFMSLVLCEAAGHFLRGTESHSHPSTVEAYVSLKLRFCSIETSGFSKQNKRKNSRWSLRSECSLRKHCAPLIDGAYICCPVLTPMKLWVLFLEWSGSPKPFCHF